VDEATAAAARHTSAVVRATGAAGLAERAGSGSKRRSPRAPCRWRISRTREEFRPSDPMHDAIARVAGGLFNVVTGKSSRRRVASRPRSLQLRQRSPRARL